MADDSLICPWTGTSLTADQSVGRLTYDLYLTADADCAGLPKTLRHPSLKCARCRRMQAVIRSTSGISEEQSRQTSGVQSRR